MATRISRGILTVLFAATCISIIYLAVISFINRPAPAPALYSKSYQSTIIPQYVSPDVFSNPYAPPTNSTYALSHGPPLPSVNTRRTGGAYTQSGILVSGSGSKTNSSTMILPLFGRQIDRSKFQYYALSNTGAVNTKLPVRISNRRCTAELGCDEIYNGDSVYVEGYGDIFIATIYDTPQITYTI